MSHPAGDGLEARLTEHLRAEAGAMPPDSALWERLESRLGATRAGWRKTLAPDRHEGGAAERRAGQGRGASSTSAARGRFGWALNLAGLATFVVLVGAIALGLSTLLSGRAGQPVPASGLLDGFTATTDRALGYRMLVPSGWESLHMGTSRGYFPPGSAGKVDRVLLSAVNLGALERAGPDKPVIVGLELFRKTPTLAGWTAAQERLWAETGLDARKERAHPDAIIYSLRPSPDRVQLVAYKVDRGQPLVVALDGYGRYGSVSGLESEGLIRDLETMVASAEALPFR